MTDGAKIKRLTQRLMMSFVSFPRITPGGEAFTMLFVFATYLLS